MLRRYTRRLWEMASSYGGEGQLLAWLLVYVEAVGSHLVVKGQGRRLGKLEIKQAVTLLASYR